MLRSDLRDGMKVIDTDDGMIMEYKKTDKSDYFCTKDAKWGVCQFDLSVYEPYEGELSAGEFEKNKACNTEKNVYNKTEKGSCPKAAERRLLRLDP